MSCPSPSTRSTRSSTRPAPPTPSTPSRRKVSPSSSTSTAKKPRLSSSSSLTTMDGEDNFKENEKPPPDEEVDELNEERKRRRRSLSVASTASSSRDTKRSRLVRTESLSSEDAYHLASSSSSFSSSCSHLVESLPTPPATPAKAKALTRSSSSGSVISSSPSTLASVPKASIFATARSLLRCSTTTAIVGRAAERATLGAFLQSDSSKTLYVAGQPGTGKTALVTSVAATIASPGDEWRVGTINCVGVTDVWNVAALELGFTPASNSKKAKDAFVKALEQDKKTKFLLVLDEFDSLISLTAATSIPTQASIHLLEALLSLPVAHPNVRVIAIANSLDLPSRFLSHLEPQPELLSFTAYDNADLSAIVRARLRSLLSSPEDESAKTPLADDKAIELVARRVQAENGDLRMCLDVCRLAIELVEGEQRKKALVKSQQAAAAFADEAVLTAGTSPTSSAVTAHLTSFTALDAPRAGMPHVLKALQKAKANASSSSMASPAVPLTATFALPGSPATKRAPSSVTIAKIKATNIQSRLVLVALLVHSRRASWGLPPLGIRASAAAAASAVAPRMSSLAITTTMTLHSTYHHLLSASDSPVRAVTPSDFLTIVTNLADAALISLAPLTPSKRRSATERKVDLACLEEEIVKGLVGFGAGDSEAGAIEEEARRILEREEARIERAREGRRRDAAKEKECPIEDRL